VFLSIHESKANFDFSPISSRLLTEGRSSSLMAKIVNRSDAELPIVIQVKERTLSESGEELRSVTDDIDIFPRQFILGPREERHVKILWRGPKDLPYEKAYRILVDHVPVDLAPQAVGGGAIRIMLSYSAMVYVSSRQVAPRVEITRIEPATTQRRLLVALENSGDAHSILANPELDLFCVDAGLDESQKLTLKRAALQNIDSKNLLARSTLITSINIPLSLSKCSNFKWSFRYDIP
jgi:P pilus assembly chaperone PapD